MIQSLTKTVAVSVCSTILATLAVNATDMRGTLELSMLARLFAVVPEQAGPCPSDMVLVTQALVPFCIDRYETSPSDGCLYTEPSSQDETAINLSDPACMTTSLPARRPWVYIAQTEAQQACARSGKRLPTASEWYRASLGTPDSGHGWTDEHCNVASNVDAGLAGTGQAMRCVSDSGAYDMVGNAWEWVEDQVEHGNWNGRRLPSTGYVTGVDKDGIAFDTATAIDPHFVGDRFWVNPHGVMGMMRGGYYGGEINAGIFSTYAASPPSFVGEAVGFRCAMTPVSNS
jgi:formylglycine-generating enzyme required for sulfatase activity